MRHVSRWNAAGDWVQTTLITQPKTDPCVYVIVGRERSPASVEGKQKRAGHLDWRRTRERMAPDSWYESCRPSASP